jgi:hypothetical protein
VIEVESKQVAGRVDSRVGGFCRIRVAVAVAKSRELRKSRVSQRRQVRHLLAYVALHMEINPDPYCNIVSLCSHSRLLSSSNRPGIVSRHQ